MSSYYSEANWGARVLRARDGWGGQYGWVAGVAVVDRQTRDSLTDKNCMPDPSVCGYPDVESVGVTAGRRWRR